MNQGDIRFPDIHPFPFEGDESQINWSAADTALLGFDLDGMSKYFNSDFPLIPRFDAMLTGTNIQFTVGMWLRPTLGASSMIMLTNSDGLVGSIEPVLFPDGSMTVILYETYHVNSSQYTTVAGVIQSDVWQWIVFRVDLTALPDDKCKIFINGIESANTPAHSGTGVGTTILTPGTNWDFGQAMGALYFDGVLHKLCAWEVALSDASILATYNGGVPLDYSVDSGDYAESSSLRAYFDPISAVWSGSSWNWDNESTPGEPFLSVSLLESDRITI